MHSPRSYCEPAVAAGDVELGRFDKQHSGPQAVTQGRDVPLPACQNPFALLRSYVLQLHKRDFSIKVHIVILKNTHMYIYIYLHINIKMLNCFVFGGAGFGRVTVVQYFSQDLLVASNTARHVWLVTQTLLAHKIKHSTHFITTHSLTGTGPCYLFVAPQGAKLLWCIVGIPNCVGHHTQSMDVGTCYC